MLVSEKPCGPNATPHLPNANSNASRWNIGCVGSPGVGACVGHVHFMLFVSISFAFPVEYGLKGDISVISHRFLAV